MPAGYLELGFFCQFDNLIIILFKVYIYLKDVGITGWDYSGIHFVFKQV